MDSIYYVITWLCHRTCDHCYDDRFRPYPHGAPEHTSPEAIVAHFPDVLGKVILAGGEVLLDPVRESVLYPTLHLLYSKYGDQTRIIVQTTGDLLTPKIAAELRTHHVSTISVSGMDDFHAGMIDRRDKIEAMLVADGGDYNFFGATPDQWIGKLWPRGRAWKNGLSQATMEDNFCNQWSGGLNFLGGVGAEVSIEPNGNVYPCCLKTKLPIGNLHEAPLETILARHRGNPVYIAINGGQPQHMGLAHGWSTEDFRRKSRVILESGQVYENLCIGCDRFHDEVLSNSASDGRK